MKKYKIINSLLAMSMIIPVSGIVSCSNNLTDKPITINPKQAGNIVYDKDNNYYDGTKGLRGEALLNKLYVIQNTHLSKIRKAHPGYNDLYSTYREAFKDTMYEKDGSILDIYSENPNGSDPYNFRHGKKRCGSDGYEKESDCYNREHVIPQSKFDKRWPMHNDAQFVWPTDGKVNGMRSNYPHGIVNSVEETSKNGSKLGSGANGDTVFEPIDEFKGDIVRAYFYFQLTYHGKANSFTPFISSFPYFSSVYLTTYIKWTKEDPVDVFDIQRNNGVASVQGNRNPFCDYPELIDLIWGNDSDTFNNNGIAIKIK